MIAVVFVFFFLALFDSVGTLVGVGQQAGLHAETARCRGRGRRCSRTRIGTVAGAALGTSTVTAHIEAAPAWRPADAPVSRAS